MAKSFYRTYKELKPPQQVAEIRELRGFYRTYKELKLFEYFSSFAFASCFYRTYKELKPLLTVVIQLFRGTVFIVPIRN